MRAGDGTRELAVTLAALLIACAGAAPQPGVPTPPSGVQGEAGSVGRSCEELLARLDVLIANHDSAQHPGSGLAEARALRGEAVALLATGDESLAREFLISAIALLEGDAE